MARTHGGGGEEGAVLLCGGLADDQLNAVDVNGRDGRWKRALDAFERDLTGGARQGVVVAKADLQVFAFGFKVLLYAVELAVFQRFCGALWFSRA